MSGVVIGVGAVIGAVIGGGSALHGASKQNRNLIKTFKKQMHYMQINYNYNQATLDRQERSMYDSAVANLFKLSVNAFQNQSQVEAAQAESGVEGRSQDKIGQIIRGTNLRQKTALKEAYEVDVWNVRSKKEALYIETKSAVEQARDNLNNNFIKGSKLYAQLFQGVTTGAALGAATAGIGSAVGGALGGATSGALAGSTAPALGSMTLTPAASATAGAGVGAVTNTSLGAGFLSSYGVAASAGSAGLGAGLSTAPITASALSSGASAAYISGSLGVASGLSNLTTSASTGTSTSTSTGIMGRIMTNYQQYKPYTDFVNQWTNFYNQNLNYRKRGGVYY